MIDYNNMDVTSLSLEEIENLCVLIRKEGKYVGIIYCYTNNLNNKKYIGQTISPKDRHFTHISSSKNNVCRNDINLPIHNAIRKYGIDKFQYSVLCLVEDKNKAVFKKKLNNAEEYYIALHDSTNKNKGYNIRYGGYCGADRGVKVNQYTKFGEFIRSFESIAEARRLTKCKNISNSISRKLYYANGYVFVPEGTELPIKIFEKHKALVIHQYSESGEYIKTYDSAREAAKSVNGDHSRITLCAKTPTKNVAYGYRWSFQKQDKLKGEISHFIAPVYQYDKNGNFIAEYPHLRAAAKGIGVKSATHIGICLNDRWRKAKGFYWRREKCDKIEIITKKKAA